MDESAPEDAVFDDVAEKGCSAEFAMVVMEK